IVVCEDCDIELTVNALITAAFSAAGQSCVAGARLIVHETVADRVIDALVNRAHSIRIGDPRDPTTELGPLCTARQLEAVAAAVDAARAAGARVLCGGERLPQTRGFFWPPTIIECDDDTLAVWREELFAPVLCVRRFREEADAIALANASRYHYASGVFTRDLGRAFRLMRAIQGGVFYLNTWRVVSPSAPFGGNRDTGWGREGGIESIQDYTRPRTVWINFGAGPAQDPFRMR
ncbi:MAG: aldehyde dehydrogenase family protein, partial [Burkholderiales bacterium]|nr:aldehyde dehydrogenase family protein [Burkholderiales bacterium]